MPKEKGFLNVGVGGMAERIKRGGKDIRLSLVADHRVTRSQAGATGAQYDPHGYSYFLRGKVESCALTNAFIAGDAAGLATRDMARALAPRFAAVIRAAECDSGRCAEYQLRDVTGASLGGGLRHADVRLGDDPARWR